MQAALYYAHDPMCSWCWAFRPAYYTLHDGLPEQVELIRLLGGLAPDNERPMNETMRHYVQGQWQTIQQMVPGTRFNYAFWEQCRPRRSTYPACRAVIAARRQDSEYDDKMTLAIQQGYYLQARNPSDTGTLVKFAGEIGLDTKQFADDLSSSETEQTLQAEIRQCGELGLFGFPGLLLVANNDRRFPIDTDYLQPEKMLQQINDALTKQ